MNIGIPRHSDCDLLTPVICLRVKWDVDNPANIGVNLGARHDKQLMLIPFNFFLRVRASEMLQILDFL